MVEVFQRLNPKKDYFSQKKRSFADMKAVVEQEKAAGGSRGHRQNLKHLCLMNSVSLQEHSAIPGTATKWDTSVGDACWLGKSKKMPGKCRECGFDWDVRRNRDRQRGFGQRKTAAGLCALAQLREAGITHLVGRGNYVDFMEKISGVLKKGTGGFRRE